MLILMPAGSPPHISYIVLLYLWVDHSALRDANFATDRHVQHLPACWPSVPDILSSRLYFRLEHYICPCSYSRVDCTSACKLPGWSGSNGRRSRWHFYYLDHTRIGTDRRRASRPVHWSHQFRNHCQHRLRSHYWRCIGSYYWMGLFTLITYVSGRLQTYIIARGLLSAYKPR
jgi:hypothetical protein